VTSGVVCVIFLVKAVLFDVKKDVRRKQQVRKSVVVCSHSSGGVHIIKVWGGATHACYKLRARRHTGLNMIQYDTHHLFCPEPSNDTHQIWH